MTPTSQTSVLLAGLVLIELLFSCIWIASLARKDASLVDRFWGAAFVVLAWWFWLTRPAGEPNLQGPVLLATVTVWGLRLSGFLTWRNWGKGEDHRYAEMRARDPAGFPGRSYFTVFLLQGLLVWLIGMPLFPGLRSGDPGNSLVLAAGVACWVVGFVFEAGGDWQLARHRADPARRGRVLDTGLWRYTRHPNYFGDAAVWWGFWLMAAAGGGWWTLFAPLLMTALLLRVSGVTLLERALRERRPDYADYAARTSAFIPWPPAGAKR